MDAAAVFASTFTYAHTKLLGAAWVSQELESLDRSCVGAFRTLGELRNVARFDLYQDGGTLITKSRSRAAGIFLRGTYDVWVSVDDDVFASSDVLARLVEAARATRGVVGAPCALRAGTAVNFPLGVALLDKALVRRVGGCSLYSVSAVGFGLVAFHRNAIERMAGAAPMVTEGEGAPYPGLFLETVEDGRWWGEDHLFCRRCVLQAVDVDILLEAPTCHAGHWLQVSRDLELMARAARYSGAWT